MKSLVLFLFALAVLVPAAVTAQPAVAPSLRPGASATGENEYRLGSGDKLRIIVFGEDDLGGEYVVDGNGDVRLPLIGQVQAAGRTLREFEADVKTQLDAGYLKDARVSAEVTNYRPFYIMGEVNKAGEYPFVNGMSVLNAVALAGGYTYRANANYVYVRRSGTDRELQLRADQTTKINPGDIIRIPERFF